MTMRNRIETVLTLAIVAIATLAFSASPAKAELFSQLGILDLSANAGINPATGLAWADGDTYRLIFASSTGIDASSSSIAVYDAHVDGLATTAGYGSVTWKALASTPTVDGIDNTGLTGVKAESFWLLDGTTKIADDYTDFWDGHTSAEAIDVSETGGSPLDSGDFTSLWTGSGSDGRGVTGKELGDAGGVSRGGLWGGAASAAQWINRFDLPQTTAGTTGDGVRALYGVSEPLTVSAPPPVIPEPSTLVLAALGMLGLIALGRRRRRR